MAVELSLVIQTPGDKRRAAHCYPETAQGPKLDAASVQ